MRFILNLSIFILLAVFFWAPPPPIFAADDPALAEILKGFEDTPSESKDEQPKEQTDTSNEKEAPKEDIDDILKGFEESSDKQVAEDQKDISAPSRFSLEGYIEFGAIVNFAHDAPATGETDWRGLSSLRTDFGLDLKLKLFESWQARVSGQGFYDFVYAIKGRDNYTEQVLDAYEKELELTDTYIQGSLIKSLDIKAGRQIVVWGKMDNLRVNDVLNPLDLRLPGLTDIEDLRLPVGMVRMDYYFRSWSLTGLFIPEIRFSKTPVFGSDYFPGPRPLPPEEVPSDGFENAQYAASVNGIFSGWDIAFYFADIYDAQTHIEIVGTDSTALRKHARIRQFGAASNLARGNWLIKAEAAWFDGLKFTNTPGEEYSRFDISAGIEYSGFKDAIVGFEAVNRHIIDFNKLLELPPDEREENEFQCAVRMSKNFLNDTLTGTFLASTFGVKVQNGFFERLSAEYDLTDTIEISGGIVFYQSGDSDRYRNIDENDRIFVEIKYSF